MRSQCGIHKKLLFSFLFILYISRVSSQIYINEFQAYNSSSYLEPWFGNFPDWIELYNPGNNQVDLEGYFITDDINEPSKWELSSQIIYSGGYTLIYADKIAYRDHTNFSLDGDGEQILLFSPSLELLDSISFGIQHPDISYGRYPDGSQNWYFFEEYSPEATNSSSHMLVAGFSEEPIFSMEGGSYSGQQSLSISTSSPTGVIRYTLTGSEPGKDSPVFSEVIIINSTTVVRAAVFDDTLFTSPTVTHTYLIDSETALPVISVSMDGDYLWNDQIGIYVEGTNGIVGLCSDTPKNFYQDWERPINIEYFDTDGNTGFNQKAGTKIFGACSRREDLKSLSIFARDKYGKDEFDYHLFRDKEIDKFKSFILRNSGNDFRLTMIRDGMMQNLVKNRMDLDFQEYQPAIFYLNGEYWGILNIREKINEDYLAANHGVDPDSVDILSQFVNVVEGDDIHYQNMMDYIRANDLSDSQNYNYVKSQMDVDQFLNYYIAQIYFFNQDWPEGNNKYWRPKTKGGRWRWMLFDTDFGFGLKQFHNNMVQWVVKNDPSTELFRELLTNDEFYAEFLQRTAGHMNTTFVPERVVQLIDSLSTNIEDDIDDQIEKWKYPYSLTTWYNEIEELRTFANSRIPLLRSNLMSEFSLTGTVDLSASVSNPAFGRIRISEVEIPSEYSGPYFQNLPVRLEAIPEPGYAFYGWEGASNSGEMEIELILDSNTTIVANFGSAEQISNLHLNELSSSGDNSIEDEYGEYEDWIEISNSGPDPVDLAGLYITDSIEWLDKFQISFGHSESTILLPDSSMIFYADSDPEQGVLHLDFKLNNDGETIALSQRTGMGITILDSVTYSGQVAGVTVGRLPDWTGTWQKTIPTPGKSNVALPNFTGLFINEFSASNSTMAADEYGEYDDWIEIYNSNDNPVDIGGLFLTDSLADPTNYRIPTTSPDSTTIPGNGYLILWADNQAGQGGLHLDFGLRRGGEQIGLVDYSGEGYIDSLSYGEQYTNSSLSRYPDGESNWRLLPPTPGGMNDYTPITGLFINEFSASNFSIIGDDYGEFGDWIEIYNSNDEPVDIGGLFLTDSLADRTNYRIPTISPDSTTIPGNGYLVLWADNQSGQGILHLDFGLRRDGEQIGLVDYSGEVYIDSFSYGEQYTNSSLSRFPDGESNWRLLPPTPGGMNVYTPITGLFINEFSASNSTMAADEYGEYDDWIEIYNSNDEPVDIGGLFLTDSLADRTNYRIPTTSPDSTTIPGNGYLILWADNQAGQGGLHLDFGLRRGGEQIGLVDYSGEGYIDSLSYGEQYTNSSLSRYPDGESNWRLLPPTPGGMNVYTPITGLFINEFSASNSTMTTDEYGEYDDWIEIYNSNDEPVDIGGLFLTDSLADRTNYRIPTTSPDSTTIPGNGYLILWADNQAGQGGLHLDFGLRRDGEQIGLVDYSGEGYIDSLSYGEQYTNSSLSRYPDGESNWRLLPPTPGGMNDYTPITGLFINEFSASNFSIIGDENGEFGDWIEIYNSNDNPVDIGGLFLTDSLADPTNYRIPTISPDSTTIPGNGYLVLWADNQSGQGVLHLDFGLRRGGEQIGLVDYSGEGYIDSLSYGEQYTNSSLSRYPDGESNWRLLPPTPGGMNDYTPITGLFINEFSASNFSIIGDDYGEFGDWIEIYNSNDNPVDIGGLFLTDSLADPTNYRIPTTSPDSTTIPARGYLVLWADNQTGQGILHLGFGLRRDGEQIGLVDYSGEVYIDSLTYHEQYQDASVSRFPNGESQWQFLLPTPGTENMSNAIKGLYINEFSSSNRLLITDKFNEFDDWIELYNSNDYPVDIGGLFFTDSLGESTKYRISTSCPDSTTIPGKGYLVFWADNQDEQGVLHLDFGLSREGDQIGLVHYNGLDFIDSVSYGVQLINTSLSRYPDGEQSWLFIDATPGGSNIKDEYGKLYINEYYAGKTAMNSFGNIEDGGWIEIFNNNDYSINIGGLYMTDSLLHPGKHRIPTTSPDSTTISSGGHLLLYPDNMVHKGVLHLNFQLNKGGDQIGLAKLLDTGYVYIDTVAFIYQKSSVSTGRVNDGVNSWTNFTDPTPGKANSYTFTGISENSMDNLIAYPNPVSNGVLHLNFLRNVKLFNSQGNLVYQENNVSRLNLDLLPDGIYLLRTDQGEIIRIVII